MMKALRRIVVPNGTSGTHPTTKHDQQLHKSPYIAFSCIMMIKVPEGGRLLQEPMEKQRKRKDIHNNENDNNNNNNNDNNNDDNKTKVS